MFKDAFTKFRFNGWLILALMLLAAIFSGCAPQSTPPGPDTAAGAVGQGGYAFLRWKKGLRLMIWHDGSKGSMCHGSSSTTDPVHRLECYAESQNGQRVGWELHTHAGKTIQFWIDKASYDLSEGNLFIITTRIRKD